jgi:2-amino-4-hydroxy-6-hydroxymethyldihydropteridine diphosphokinase
VSGPPSGGHAAGGPSSPQLTLLGLGGNVGDALETLTAAVYALDDDTGFAVEDVSGVYETPPWPAPPDPRAVAQDPYLNLVVRGLTTLAPHDLLAETQLIEAAFGRDRSREQRWGPRPLDIDLLVVGDHQLDTPELVLPHPRLADRAFVLVPLLEVWPGGTLPDGRRLTTLLAALAPIEDIDLVVRLSDVPGRHVVRPEGPSAPPASHRRPGLDPTPDGPLPAGDAERPWVAPASRPRGPA